ncbi:phosducin-like protein [Thrips palmi]|uniref:Phosducin-like protein n=1 Tax=Thrips palmi TaxID=161013 RepID=A0A6P8ZXW1_THRPL|nr:phosducin-like protein [Thrips palmi]
MATLEDKILGEKLHNYCSSSEDEDEKSGSGDEETGGKETQPSNSNALPQPEPWSGSSTNTGPKGVIKDWQRFKQLETEKRAEQEKEKLELIKKLSLTCQSALDDEKDKAKAEQLDPELQELLEDSFLLQYQEKRMKEMLDQYKNLPSFGKLISLNESGEFLEVIDNEHAAVTVIIHICENNISGCHSMNSCLECLSEKFPKVKFCKILSSVAGMSQRFKSGGLPALLAYKGGQLIGNFVRITDDLGSDFSAEEVEAFLIEHGVIPDQSCIPKIIQQSSLNDDDDDEDDD